MIIDGKQIEEVDGYVYIGQMGTKDHDQQQEMKGKSDRDGVHSVSWGTSCETKMYQ